MNRLATFVQRLCAILVAALLLAAAARAEPATLDQVMAKLAPPPSGEALALIPDEGRKMLALRSYLRYGPKIAERWSWTDAEVKAFEGSAEHKALMAEIAAVDAHFQAANPGYKIYVHNTTRSLNEQITKWNANDSVGAGGAEILAAYKAAFGESAAAPDPDKLSKWLRAFQPAKRANLAAPGLTLHGRASAIDFQIMKDGAIYAGADTRKVESIWRAEGFDVKLKASMTAAGPSFVGPLTNPDEPWHYEYVPKPGTAAATASE